MNTQIPSDTAPASEFVSRDELVNAFLEAEKPEGEFRIGAESEKFGVHRKTGAPLMYEGDFSVGRVISHLCEDHGWQSTREFDEGPILGAKRGGASVTLEPGAQFELSGEALFDLHQIKDETSQHLAEISAISKEMDIAWLAVGFHPTAQLVELPWVPKVRYPIMRAYLPERGKAGTDMMQRTCTTQGNFDWRDERDAMTKVIVALKLSPLIQAWFSNAPFKEGKTGSLLSHRAVVWQNMDPARSGLLERLWEKDALRYEDYIEWALDAGMFLIRRGSTTLKNTGQTFRDFLANGFQGERATLDDWRAHLVTLFPEVRLKNTLEVRSVDALPPDLSLASLAVWTGILYDEQALQDTFALLKSWSFAQVEGARPALAERALHAELCGRSGFDWAEQIFELADAGLKRRARMNQAGQDESILLKPAAEIVATRCVPAERAKQLFEASGSLITATEIHLP